ncbi:MAG: ABC transporter ATP-binding protein, partial [Devosia sp.]
ILLDGRDISDDAPVDRDVAMVFQSYALYPQMTVAENIGFALSVAKEPRATIDKKVDDVSKLLRLDDYLARKPSALSGGQRQRVAIGRAIVRDPKVFLFDEPLSNLDAELRVEMRLQIAQLRRRLSATFVYVTHDQVEAMTLADTIVVLRMGVIEQVGSPMELYHKPANQFVAGFIGSPRMNFIPAGQVSGIDLKGAATVGVRPEHVLVDANGPLKGVIRTVENLGAVSYAYAALPDETLVTIVLPPDHSVSVDQPLAVGIVPGRAYLFDASGKTI